MLFYFNNPRYRNARYFFRARAHVYIFTLYLKKPWRDGAAGWMGGVIMLLCYRFFGHLLFQSFHFYNNHNQLNHN